MKKLIVTNQTALINKYGEVGFQKIDNTIQELIESDQSRSITDTLVYLDQSQQMNALGASPVSSIEDEEGNKTAIDTIYKKLKADYLLIIGAQDVVPFQHLNNPISGDGDLNVPSDLPYACDAGFSTQIKSFTNPNRPVGRIPGVYKPRRKKRVDYLLKALKNAVEWKSLPRNEHYQDYFAISTMTWEKSSRLSLLQIMGNSNQLHTSPSSGPRWKEFDTSKKIYFVNCHGRSRDTRWSGEDNSGNTPVTLYANRLLGNVSKGTVIAAECCYGAELFENGGGVCNAILQDATTFFGSTNTSYGLSDTRVLADILTQYFLSNILHHIDNGLALLKARRDYISGTNLVKPSDLKTIAQFCLFGDPTAQPVAPRLEDDLNEPIVKSLQKAMHTRLNIESLSRVDDVGYAELVPDLSIPGDVLHRLHACEEDMSTTQCSHHVFEVNGSENYENIKNSFIEEPHRVYLSVGKLPGDKDLTNIALVEIETLGDDIISISRAISK